MAQQRTLIERGVQQLVKQCEIGVNNTQIWVECSEDALAIGEHFRGNGFAVQIQLPNETYRPYKVELTW